MKPQAEMDDIIKKRLAEEEQDWLIGTYYYYTAFISRHVSHQFGNANSQEEITL